MQTEKTDVLVVGGSTGGVAAAIAAAQPDQFAVGSSLTQHRAVSMAGGSRRTKRPVSSHYRKAIAPSPVCVPMRSTLLTGLNAIRTGVMGNGQFLRPDLADCGIDTWPKTLSQNGYRTCAIGKMHFYPWEASMGFHDRVICEDKRWIHIDDDYQKYLNEKGTRKLHGNEHEGYQEIRLSSTTESTTRSAGSCGANWTRSFPPG